MLVVDGRTGKTHDIQAGLPQGSPASPVLFNLSISAIFQWLEEKHPTMEAISFVDDIGLVLRCNDLEQGTRELESIARHAVEWGDSNKVEFEISKTEVILFSRQGKVLQTAKEARIRIGEHEFSIKRGATRWLGFWLDPKLSFKTHFEKRLANAKGALQRIRSLSGSNGGLPMKLMRRITVAAVNSVALYGAEVWWRGQQDRAKRLQLLLNSQARAITGMLSSTPIAILLAAANLPYAVDLLDSRQARYAVRALSAPQDHPTHQLLPANFRVGQLYRHEGAKGHLSSIGWLSHDKTHRTLGGRLAQQVTKSVTYDTEYGFGLLERADTPVIHIEIRIDEPDQALQRMSEEQPYQLTLFSNGAEGFNFGAGIAWEGHGSWQTKTTPIGKYLTPIDAELFAITAAAKEAGPLLRKTQHQVVEIVSGSREALTAISETSRWVSPLVKELRHHAKHLRQQEYSLVLSWLPGGEEIEGAEVAEQAASQASEQHPRQMRSASLPYVLRCVKAKGQRTSKMNKRLGNGKKSTATRYLQLKSGHAVTGVHLRRTKQTEDARCWWCGNSRQSVAHLMLDCRKWRRERETLLSSLEARKIRISARKDDSDLKVLFSEAAMETVLHFIEGTAIGKRREIEETQRADERDVSMLDRDDGETQTSA
jgi:hypothetical protein